MTTTDAERYVLMLYRAARAHCTPIQAIDCARNQVANELAYAYCANGADCVSEYADKWDFADQCRAAIHARAQEPNDTGLFWDTGVCTAKPRYWNWSVRSGTIIHDSSKCPTLSCAVKHASYSAQRFDAETILFETGIRHPIRYRTSAGPTRGSICSSLRAQGAFA